MTSGTMVKTSRAGAHNFLVIVSLTTVFLFAGTIMGWGAFSSMLQSEGYYSYLCELPDPAQPCRKQLQALNNAFTAAITFLTLTSYLNGWLVDIVGPKTVTGIAGCLSCLGLSGIALTKVTGWSNHAEAIIFLVTMALAGFGGAMTIKIGCLAPFMVPSCFTLLMAVNSCVFDAGTVVYPLLKVLYDLLWTVQVTTLIGVVYNILQLVPSLYVQLVTVLMFTVWRAFLYSTISSFNGQIFGVKTMGRIQGLGFLVAGLANLLNGTRVDAAIHSGDYTSLLLENLGMTIPFPVVFYLLQRQRAKGAKSPASSAGSQQRSTTSSPSEIMSMTEAPSGQSSSEEISTTGNGPASSGEP